jgi:hypothetical protein
MPWEKRSRRAGADRGAYRWERWSSSRGRRKAADPAVAAAMALPMAAPAADSRPSASDTLTELERAGLHVVRGQEIVDRQRDLVFELRRHGHDSQEAEKLLRTFQDVLFEARKHLARLQIQHRRRL